MNAHQTEASCIFTALLHNPEIVGLQMEFESLVARAAHGC